MNESFYARHSWKIIIGLVLSYPLIGYGALQAIRSNTNDVKQWLPAGFQETQQYQWFRGHFEAEEFILISWDGCTLDDERLERFAKRLDPPSDAHPKAEPLFSNVVTGPRVLERLTTPPTNLPHDQAVARLEGSLIGHDRQQTCAVLTLSETAKRDLHHTLNHVYSTAEACGVPRDSVRMGGPPVDNVAIDNAGQQSLFRLAAFSGLIGLVVSWRSLRSWWLVAIVFGAGLYTAAASLAMVYYTGVQMNAILLTMPPLVYVAATSGAIHLANYYREVIQHCSPFEAPAKALRHALLPLSLATGTTAVGLMSLCISELAPIQLFGLYSAIGVCISMLLLVFFVPAALQVWPQPALAVAVTAPQLHTSRGTRGSRRWMLAGHKIIRHNGWVAVGCLAVMGVGGYGLTKVQTSVQLMRLFDSQARILKDYGWLEEHVGELVPMEVVLHVDQRTSKLSFLEQMELVQAVQEKVEAIEVVGSSLSAVTFAPPIPESKGSGWSVERSVRNKRLLRHREEFLAGDYLRDSAGEYLWRITARVGALKDVDYGQFVSDIRQVVEPLLAERGGREAGIHATYTGLVPLVYKAQRSLLDGLIFGFIGDLALITIVMMIAVRDWSAGLLLITASAFPAVVIFGLMGWLGIVVDVGTVMAPAVALGVTVDDVVHFMLSFRHGLAEGQSRRQAILGAYRTCGRAMFQSWGVIGLGLAIFALSPFRPTQCFGYLMATLLTAALAGNLLLLPSLLASPLGRFFRVRQTSGRRSEEPETSQAEAGLAPTLRHSAA